MMILQVTCQDCGTVNGLNPKKHACRPKWCQGCRAVVAKPMRAFTKFYVIRRFLSQLPIIRQKIEKDKKIKEMRLSALLHENKLMWEEARARRELARMLKDFPHLQEWVE